MRYQYSEEASTIVEQFLAPTFLNIEEIGDFNKKERDILGDNLQIKQDLHDLFLPYKDRIESYYLMGYGLSILHVCYFDMVEKQLPVQTVEDVHQYCLQLSSEDIQKLLKDLLDTEMEHKPENSDFWERLDMANFKAETKWHYSQFYRKPLEEMAELVTLSRELVELYQPYLKKGEAERQSFGENFSFEDLVASAPNLAQYDWKFGDEKHTFIYILSPWIVTFSSHGRDCDKNNPTHYIIISSHIDRLLASRKELDTETFASTLKILSDSTRYKVLAALTEPHAKSKAIAEDLNISGAAVSFHTQKLINAQLLLFNRDDKNIKYNINKELLNDVIDKLQEDFGL